MKEYSPDDQMILNSDLDLQTIFELLANQEGLKSKIHSDVDIVYQKKELTKELREHNIKVNAKSSKNLYKVKSGIEQSSNPLSSQIKQNQKFLRDFDVNTSNMTPEEKWNFCLKKACLINLNENKSNAILSHRSPNRNFQNFEFFFMKNQLDIKNLYQRFFHLVVAKIQDEFKKRK